ncbi:MAG: branched-chain amino acid aminotransferase [Eggerthellaceae bacterium]|nr:branched-chain amino acid aminotransferase [Eggerthellaceae bacterium]
MSAEKKNLDWGNLGFAYIPTDFSYVCNYKNGAWGEGFLTSDHSLQISECAGIFHYCQEVFEGLKAYTTRDGRIVCFRPDLNAERMYASAQRLCMPPFPIDRFIDAVKTVVKANEAWVPPFGSGATLYVRPFMIATGDVIGVKAATEYQFRILVTPVGPYFKGGDTSVKLTISDFDRAAPRGTGNIKAGLNYAMSLYATEAAHHAGYAENLYLDSQTRTFIEETGGANVLFAAADSSLVVPKSATDSILPSITRRSLIVVARDILGMQVVERAVKFEEVQSGAFEECGLCGTAAVISPVAGIEKPEAGISISFPKAANGAGPIMAKLRKTLTDIQTGEAEGPQGWVVEIN